MHRQHEVEYHLDRSASDTNIASRSLSYLRPQQHDMVLLRSLFLQVSLDCPNEILPNINDGKAVDSTSHSQVVQAWRRSSLPLVLVLAVLQFIVNLISIVLACNVKASLPAGTMTCLAVRCGNINDLSTKWANDRGGILQQRAAVSRAPFDHASPPHNLFFTLMSQLEFVLGPRLFKHFLKRLE